MTRSSCPRPSGTSGSRASATRCASTTSAAGSRTSSTIWPRCRRRVGARGAAVRRRARAGAVVEPVPRAGDGGGAGRRSRRRLGRGRWWAGRLRPRRAARGGARSAGFPNLADTVRGAGGPLALLGECTLAPAVTAGLRRRHPDLALVWVDAHGDLNTPETTPSGFLGGMPFAILLGWCHDELRGRGRARARRFPRSGRRWSAPATSTPASGTRSPARGWWSPTTSRAALAGLPDDAPLHVHLDGDVLDPEDAPGVDFPAPGGWRLPHLVDEMAALAATGRVVGVSLCCGNPRRDPEGRSARGVRPRARAGARRLTVTSCAAAASRPGHGCPYLAPRRRA